MVRDIKLMRLTKSSLEALNKNQMLTKKSERKMLKLCLYAILTFMMCGMFLLFLTTTSNKELIINESSNLNDLLRNTNDGDILNKEEIEALKFIFSKYPKENKDAIDDANKMNEGKNAAGNNIKLMKKYKDFIFNINDENKEDFAKMLHVLLKNKINEKKKKKKQSENNDEEGNKLLSNFRTTGGLKSIKNDDKILSEVNTENILFNMKYASKFLKFMKKYNRNYKDINEQIEKYENFKVNYIKIKNHNKMNHTYKMKINQFGDYSKKDFEKYFKKLLPIPNHLKEKYVTPFSLHMKYKKNKLTLGNSNLFASVPENLDYREKGIVHEPKDQGLCGSCWAFASVGNVECMYAKEHNKTILTLSEQEVVDCSKLNFGCDGGHPFYSFIYAIENGICLGDEYKYRAMDNLFCLNYRCKNKVTLSSVGGVMENELIRALNEVGPVSVNVGVTDDFSFYDGGIFNGTCTEELNHSVLLVGYGQVRSSKIFQKNGAIESSTSVMKDGTDTTHNNATDDIKYYWIIKNSWSKNWGENGFMRISRNKEGDNVFCGIGIEVFYPIL
ncbi:cysteine proteinase precursor,vivapain-1 [Plasmodium gonderi]|uniref:Cysteine proteinase,vivapain-1 n=1 Tax=Plasmodium gonderi TaxID=77519 RepID=A0A1Y1JJ37_PLAGO|nr:cysteine proteinase precursor,vivapain-1 [Plasmodium gonderi]GAW82506.1 cysteine proteinase precursor,vivapain-1 [Plasmodium gonderi]